MTGDNHETVEMRSSPGLAGRRVAILGNSGSGKSTLARALSNKLGVPHIELDALNWQPGWKALSIDHPARWSDVVSKAVAAPEWITDGNYSKGAQPHILPRATDVVWLDYPRWLIMGRVLRRSLRRALSGHELWPNTGNRENFRHWLQADHPIRWTWDTYASANAKREALFTSDALRHAQLHRFKRPKETAIWLSEVAVRQCV